MLQHTLRPLPGRGGIPSKGAPSAIRLRKSATALSAAEVDALGFGISGMLTISDDRGYEYWAGIHGLPLPMYCTHGSPLFLPWHRAYLYFFEQYLLDQETTVSLPWWDWSAQQGIPDAYTQPTLPSGQPNPLTSAPVTGIPANQFAQLGETPIDHTTRQPGNNIDLPSAADVAGVLALQDFADFTQQLEVQLHNQVHVWVGGSMGEIPVAAYDPVFWAHHTMVDRLWALWQQANPGAGVGSVALDTPLPPFAMTVGQTLSITALGYQYAASSSSATP